MELVPMTIDKEVYLYYHCHVVAYLMSKYRFDLRAARAEADEILSTVHVTPDDGRVSEHMIGNWTA